MRPMTALMRVVLVDILEGRGTHYNCHGQAEHGGRCSVVTGLRQRGMIDKRNELTTHGRAVATKIAKVKSDMQAAGVGPVLPRAPSKGDAL